MLRRAMLKALVQAALGYTAILVVLVVALVLFLSVAAFLLSFWSYG